MKRLVLGGVGVGVTVLLIWVLFRSANWSEIASSIRNIHWTWFIAAQLPLALSFPARVQRWSYIVRATDPVSFRDLFSSTQIGILANFTLPARAGEAIRALALTRLAQIRFSKTLAFVTLDRVTDLFGLITVIAVSTIAFRPLKDVVVSPDTFGTSKAIVFGTDDIRIGAQIAGIVTVGIVSTLALLYFRRDDILALAEVVLSHISRRLADIAGSILRVFADGLAVFRSPAELAKSIAWSFITWGLAMVSMTCLLEAFAIDYRWYTPFVIQSVLAVFIAAPSTPGFVGQFHIPIVLGLVFTVPQIDSDTAKAFAIVYHLIQLPPVFLLGFACLLGEGMNLFQLRSEGDEYSQGDET